jgi:replicative DNA helicase
MTTPGVIGQPTAEDAYLGCLLNTGRATAEYLRDVQENDFTDPRNRAVYRTISALAERREPVDAVTVEAELRRTGLERSMTADTDAGIYVLTLMQAAPCVGSIGYYATVVCEHAVRREVQAAGLRLQQAAPRMPLDDLRLHSRQQFDALGLAFARVQGGSRG